jgi:hypothetical protein
MSSPASPRSWPGTASVTGPSAWQVTFLEAVPPGGDAYLASLVLHDWPGQQARRILDNIAAAGGSGARLLLIEFVVPPGDAPHLAKISDLNMLALMGGQERTEAEWREFLTDVGYAGITIRPTGTPFRSSRQQCDNHATRADKAHLITAGYPPTDSATDQ